MFATVINDCHCPNARGRQETRVSSLLGCPVNFIPVDSDLEASGNLVDALDAGLGHQGVILVNVAPRNGGGKKWKNGSPFAYFYYQETLVISTVAGYTLSLVRKLGLTKEIKVVDLEKTVEKNSPEQKDRLSRTQFRSLEFSPRLASWILAEKEVESEILDPKEIPEIGATVWCVDNFGNIKTTIPAGTEEERIVGAKLEQAGFAKVAGLKDAPEKKAALITGSSGIEDKRFLELVINGENASRKLGIGTGKDLGSLDSLGVEL